MGVTINLDVAQGCNSKVGCHIGMSYRSVTINLVVTMRCHSKVGCYIGYHSIADREVSHIGVSIKCKGGQISVSK
jgi:hypothetical protein